MSIELCSSCGEMVDTDDAKRALEDCVAANPNLIQKEQQ